MAPGQGTDILLDLKAEGDALDALVAELTPEQWGIRTTAEGWTIANQVEHLAASDDLATLAGRDPEAFRAAEAGVVAMLQTAMDAVGPQVPGETPADLLARWRAGRAGVLEALGGHPPGTRLPWLGSSLSPGAIATGRLMELWAHGGDVADALGVRREPTARLRHVAWLGVKTRDHAFRIYGLPVPEGEFRVELTGPDGDLWTFGPPGAAQTVTGPGLDFALLAVRRVHRDDTALKATGPDADRWLDIAQTFVGHPGPGRAPGARGA
ncbi:TIGR03084 family metal-binding protein [Yinghuangia seranimata]|uniref:TIGR03084 family metal-binding protein n=1 Tax=Yinghuangia seranimata TaxID=408067 RepID=UPI00248C538E|nr:TIGR03084 family metal-binding protein [Yinghuangia seranimata]MDI2125895.1 TIGR03084 family metal-binding protein [Yinghuangia seranimata]